MTDKIDYNLRCAQCKGSAYVDRFEGEYGVSGYICLGCIRMMNDRIVEEQKRRFFEEQKWLHRKDMDTQL